MAHSINITEFQDMPKSDGFLTDSTKNICLSYRKSDEYLHPLHLYTAYFSYLPNAVFESDIDIKKAHEWFLKNYKKEIKNYYFNQGSLGLTIPNKPICFDLYYFLYDDLLVHFNEIDDRVQFLFRTTQYSVIDNLVKGIRKHRVKLVKDNEPRIYLLTQGKYGFNKVGLEISAPQLNIRANYNEDFKDAHHIIKKRLSKRNDKGIVLLHGKPGTGKTTYIRHLISTLDKDVIFLPPNLATAITNPELMPFLIENSNSILVVEDAESIILNRENSQYSPVSNLLNITDGLLSDCLNIQLICTFNTDISKIDSALMRKGRLIAQYEFKELEIEKAQRLSDKLGYKTTLTSPMTLSAIYNQDEKSFEITKSRKLIGFGMTETPLNKKQTA